MLCTASVAVVVKGKDLIANSQVLMGIFANCSNTIRHIVRLRQMLRRWRQRASHGNDGRFVPSDVPEGHFVVCVGSRFRRYVVRTAYLKHPVFRKLLVEAAEEYGYDHSGPIAIPCDESVFEEILLYLSTSHIATGVSCNAGVRGTWQDSITLLRGFDLKSPVW